MPLSYLHNEDNKILSISDQLLTFNDIKTILKNLPGIENQNIDSLKIHKAKTILDYQKEKLNIDHDNINISLDIINEKDNIYYNNFMLYFYNQNINLNFSNYSMYNLLEKYTKIIRQIIQPIQIDQYSFNQDLLINLPKTLIELLEIRKNNTNSSMSLIDIYLKDICNAPESTNDLENYIYMLRKFPLFRLLINMYLNKNDTELSLLIEENHLEMETDTDVLLPILFNFTDTQKIKHNVNNLFKKDYYLNDFFYLIDKLNISEQMLIETYNNMLNNGFQQYGFNINNDLINLRALIDNFFKSFDYDIYKVLSLYFFLNNVSIDNIKKVSTENIRFIVSIFFMNLYFIYDYLNLEQFNPDDLQRIYNDSNNNNMGLNPENILTELLFYIHLSYYVYKSPFNNMKGIIESNINIIKHFFYIIKYSKNTLPNIFPLIFFLSCSNKKIKFIYEYHNNHILDFLNDYYDIVFGETEKIIIKAN